MQHRTAAGFQAAFQRFEIAWPIGFADSFKHFHRDDIVELTLHVAVILQPEIDPARVVFFLRRIFCPAQLGGGKGDAGHVCIVLRGEMDGECTPAAADFEYVVISGQL
ncbi:hypothetical protein D3C86_1370790 [compost metagenome]